MPHLGKIARQNGPSGEEVSAARTAELEAILSEIQAKFSTQAGAKEAYSTGNVPVTGKIRED